MSLKSTSGNVAFYPITQGPIELQNKLAQNFPEYVDPVSHKDAESPLRTDWTRLGLLVGMDAKLLLIDLMLLMVLNLLIGGLLDKFIIFVQEFMVVQMILIIYSLFPMQIII